MKEDAHYQKQNEMSAYTELEALCQGTDSTVSWQLKLSRVTGAKQCLHMLPITLTPFPLSHCSE
jgi:hypothetical protein